VRRAWKLAEELFGNLSKALVVTLETLEAHRYAKMARSLASTTGEIALRETLQVLPFRRKQCRSLHDDQCLSDQIFTQFIAMMARAEGLPSQCGQNCTSAKKRRRYAAMAALLVLDD